MTAFAIGNVDLGLSPEQSEAEAALPTKAFLNSAHGWTHAALQGDVSSAKMSCWTLSVATLAGG